MLQLRLITMPRSVFICGQIVLLAYLAFGILGIVLERRAHRYRLSQPPRGARYDQAYYAPEGHRWVQRSHLWHRTRWFVWVGGVAVMILLCGLGA
jgi:hypothetical protein